MRRRLALAAAYAALAISGAPAAAQQDSEALAKLFRVDLAVPEAPALVLSGEGTSDLLRPSSVRAFAASFGGFLGGGDTFRLPQAFAVEFAPRLLFDRTYNRDDYRRRPLLGALRVSAATRRGEDSRGATFIGLGLRTSIVNEGDPRLNVEYATEMDQRLNALRNAQRELEDLDRGVRTCANNPPDWACLLESSRASGPPAPRILQRIQCETRRQPGRAAGDVAVVRDTTACVVMEERAQPDPNLARREQLLAERHRARAQVTRWREDWEENHWNARVVDVAAAVGAVSRDSLGRDPRFQQLAAWASWGEPLLGNRAQWLLGARYAFGRDSAQAEDAHRLHAGTRLFYGANRAKGFIEGGVDLSEQRPGWSALGGVEVRLVRGVWSTVSGGFERSTSGDERLTARLTFRTAAPSDAESAVGSSK